MVYTNREQLTIVGINKGEESISIDTIIRVLNEYPSNIIYCESEGRLFGIISTGDVLRAYQKQQDKVSINRKYSGVYYGEYMKAKNAFMENNKINAIPVVTNDNTLCGDYTKWDDLLILQRLIDTAYRQNTQLWKEKKTVALVYPGRIFTDRQKIFNKIKTYLETQNVDIRCIEHSQVMEYLDKADLILFVDENEIRARCTVIKIVNGSKCNGYDKLKTYKSVLNEDMNFSNEQSASYLKTLQDKGIRILGLIFEESEYYKWLEKEIDNKYEAAGEILCNKPPKSMYKDFFGEEYDEEESEEILNVPLDFCNHGGVFSLKDHHSTYYNVTNGERCTTNQPDKYTKTIYFFGPCYIRGHYVEDKYTIESILQRQLCDNGVDIRVVNCASIGMEVTNNMFLPRIAATQLKKGDIIVLGDMPKNIEGVSYLDLSGILEKNRVGVEWLVDRVRHCNHKVNELWANEIYNVLEDLFDEQMHGQGELIEKDENLIKLLYLDKYFAAFNSSRYEKIGSIVMNCNPFTYGHRYLVEQASKMVDLLILFVVGEDKAVFSFAERYAMVYEGVRDLKNVRVVPSSPFFTSQLTMPEYFNNKQMTEDTAEHDEQDAAVFAQYIALPLGIKYRFFGEEPLDVVTNQYNISMKKILPLYGIEAVIIPRKTVRGNVVSASTVRRCLDEGNVKMLDELLPETTRKMLGLA